MKLKAFREKTDSTRMSREKVDAIRVSYITMQLDLTPQQAQEFWPVYNEYQGKLKEARREQLESIRPEGDEKRKLDDLTDEELEEMMQQRFQMEQLELNLKKAYHKRFSEVLEIRQVARLYRSEHEFKRKLFERMRCQKDCRPGERGRFRH